MSPGAAFMRATLATLNIVFDVLQWLVFVWVILSWILLLSAQTSFRWKHRKLFIVLSQLYEIFSRALEPLLRPFRRLLPPHKSGGMDWSPMLLLLTIFFVRYFLALLLM